MKIAAENYGIRRSCPGSMHDNKRRGYQTSHNWSWFLHLAHSPKSTFRMEIWKSANIFLTFSIQKKGAGNGIGLSF